MENSLFLPKTVFGRVKRKLRFMAFYLVHRLSLKKQFLCESCYKIHKIEENTLALNNKAGIFVSQECTQKVMVEARRIMRESLFKEITKI